MLVPGKYLAGLNIYQNHANLIVTWSRPLYHNISTLLGFCFFLISFFFENNTKILWLQNYSSFYFLIFRVWRWFFLLRQFFFLKKTDLQGKVWLLLLTLRINIFFSRSLQDSNIHIEIHSLVSMHQRLQLESNSDNCVISASVRR